jgi:predicted AAA+ superfamily ATPase
MYQRLLDLPGLLKRKSFFLFGPRMTGKTTIIRQTEPVHDNRGSCFHEK